MEFQSNAWLSERIVQSGSWTYLVDLQSMLQTNVLHNKHKQRHIQRLEPNEEADNADPTQDYPSAGPAGANEGGLGLKSKKPNVVTKKAKAGHKVEAVAPAATPAVVKTETNEAGEGENRETRADSKVGRGEVVIAVDESCPNASLYSVVDDYDATLSQSNIMGGNNNNKYYKMQMVKDSAKGRYFVWTRWGRVGEARGTQTGLMGPFDDMESGAKMFGKKFTGKTRNKWEDRANFVARAGKYEMLEIDHTVKKEEAEPLIMKLSAGGGKAVAYHACTLAKETKDLIELLFEKDMYTNALKEFDIDVRKMPLGALSTDQIEKGVAVLEGLEEELNGSALQQRLEFLSSKFYTTLPHDFGRQRPPVIHTKEMLQKCYDMCNVLLDMEKATAMMSEAAEKTTEKREVEKRPHPTEAQYASLKAELRLVDEGSEEHDVVTSAFERTKGRCKNSKLLNVWRVEREGEAERFAQMQNTNHALLWHGSHIGAISAILSTGLRIMPHSGGRVGRGIYLASENEKSQGYTTPASKNKIGCMFLVEAALGKISEIYRDNSSLTKPPNGYDSVLACGRQTPAAFKAIELDGRKVKVPVDAPKENPKAASSSFCQDEYLIYNEAQARIRYVITVKKESRH